MPDARKAGMVKFNAWVDGQLLNNAKKRADERGETVSEAVRKFLIRYSR